MLKYHSTTIVFQEVPDEVSLAFEISNCPHKCKGCHSPHLQKDIGESLSFSAINKHVEKYKNYISCVLFMGGDRDIDSLSNIVNYVKSTYKLKVAVYSGMHEYNFEYLASKLNADYIKVGRYEEKLGGLNSPTTNQRMYMKENEDRWTDITHKFKRN